MFLEKNFRGKITLSNADESQSNLLLKIVSSRKMTNQNILVKMLWRDTVKSLSAFYEGRKMVLNAFKSRIF